MFFFYGNFCEKNDVKNKENFALYTLYVDVTISIKYGISSRPSVITLAAK